MPLIHALSNPKDHWTGRRQRQLSEISSYQCTIVHIKGKENVVADTLSRNPPPEILDSLNAIHISISYSEIAKAQRNDEDLLSMLNLPSLKWSTFKIGETPLYCDVSSGRPRPYIPKSLREKIFNITHNVSHPSAKVTISLMTERFIWKNMKSDIRRMCKVCLNCQKSKITRHVESGTQPFPQTANRLSHLHADIVGPLPPSKGYSHLLTIIDRATRWVEAIPITSTSAESCATGLISWISRYGIPDTLVTDNGANFTSKLLHSISTSLGFKLHHTTAYNPECNGIIERMHRTLKTALTATCQGIDWVNQLPWILLGLRTTPHSALGASPAEVLYGKNIRIPADILPHPDCHTSIKETSDFIQKFLPTKLTYKIDPKTIYVPDSLKNSMYVFERVDHHKKPLAFSYEGPFPVIEYFDKYAIVNKNGKHRNISLDRLKPFFPNVITGSDGSQDPR